MKAAIRKKLEKLNKLNNDANALRIEILCELEDPYKKFIGNRVKIIGQKGWNTGILKSVRADIRGDKPVMLAIVQNGRASSGYVPFESIEFLTGEEERDFRLHTSISVGK